MATSRRRPPSSAARPTTSAAGRPTTTAGFHQPHYFGNTPYEGEYEEEYEDESEDEDVFAFLPPTTADQEAATAAAAAAAPVAGSSTGGGQSPYAVGGAGTMPAFGYHPSPASTSSSSPFSHSPFTTQPPVVAMRTSSLSPSSVPLNSEPSHSIPTYPHPTFDPWSRPAGAIPSSSTASPYSHLQLASNNPYSPTNPYASTSYATHYATHPLSPPSPSTDSHPSTGVSGVATGQELFKLKKLTSARVEEEPEPEEQLGVEERERESGRAGVIRDREAKEVRVNFPGAKATEAVQRDEDDSSPRIVARARRKSSANEDNDADAADNDDDDDEEESGEADGETTTFPDGTKSKRTRKLRHRSKKTKSKISTSTDGRGSEDVGGATTTGVDPHVGLVSVPSAAAARSAVPGTPATAERGLDSAHATHGFGFGQRMKNPNAQPYYAYAAMANAYGRGLFSLSYYSHKLNYSST